MNAVSPRAGLKFSLAPFTSRGSSPSRLLAFSFRRRRRRRLRRLGAMLVPIFLAAVFGSHALAEGFLAPALAAWHHPGPALGRLQHRRGGQLAAGAGEANAGADGSPGGEDGASEEYEAELVGDEGLGAGEDFDMEALLQSLQAGGGGGGLGDMMGGGGSPYDMGDSMEPMKSSGETETYTWRQTDEMVFVRVPLRRPVRGKDISFQITPRSIQVGIKGVDGFLIDGALGGKAKSEDSFWTLEDAPDDPTSERLMDESVAKVLAIDIEKADFGESWSELVDDEGNPDKYTVTDTVFLEVSINGTDAGRIELGLFGKVAPKTVANFVSLCKGDQGVGRKGKPLHLKGSPFHRIIPGFMLQGGDFTNEDGTGGESIYGDKFPDETFAVKHSVPGLLSMANSGPDSNGSQFFITVDGASWLDNKHCVFGRVVKGMDVVKKLEELGTTSGAVSGDVRIKDCGLVDASAS